MQRIYHQTERQFYTSGGSPPRKPPSSGTKFDPFFDGFPHVKSEKEKNKILEQTIVHLLWSKLEEIGFEVYPEQRLSKSRRIDMIASKDGKFIGIEVKCKRSEKDSISISEWEQIREYKTLLESNGIPLVVFYVPRDILYPIDGMTFSFSKREIDDRIGIAVKNFVFGLVQIDDQSRLVSLRDHVLGYSYPSPGTEQYPLDLNYNDKIPFEEFFNRLLDNARELETLPFELSQRRELYVEHALWEYLNSLHYRVLCQFPIQKDGGRIGKIDLVALRGDITRLAIEVKQRLTLDSIYQTWDYELSPALRGYSVYIGVPEKETITIQKFRHYFKQGRHWNYHS